SQHLGERRSTDPLHGRRCTIGRTDDRTYQGRNRYKKWPYTCRRWTARSHRDPERSLLRVQQMNLKTDHPRRTTQRRNAADCGVKRRRPEDFPARRPTAPQLQQTLRLILKKSLSSSFPPRIFLPSA